MNLHHHQNGRFTLSALDFSEASLLKSYDGQKLDADGDVRQGSLRTATDTSAERGPTEVVDFKTVVLRLRVSSSGRRFDVPRQPSIVFLENRQP